MHTPPRVRGGLVARSAALLVGLFLFALGIVLMLEARLGLSPWDTLHQGIAKHSPLSFGVANICVGAAVLVAAWALGAKVGIGTAANAALRHQWTILHAEHACYFFAGVLVWWPIVQGRYSSGTKALYLFGAFVFASPLGLLLALLPKAVYDFYEHAPRLWGLSPLSDQQLAGMTMAAEQAVVLFAAFAIFVRRFLHEEGRGDTFRAPTVRKT